jgi:hypothetical protein
LALRVYIFVFQSRRSDIGEEEEAEWARVWRRGGGGVGEGLGDVEAE